MTDFSSLTVTITVKETWTWPELGRRLVLISMDGPGPFGMSERLIEVAK